MMKPDLEEKHFVYIERKLVFKRGHMDPISARVAEAIVSIIRLKNNMREGK